MPTEKNLGKKTLKGAIIATDKTLSWSFVEEFVEEPPVIAAARAAGAAMGINSVSVAAGATIRMIAGALAARSVLEIGTGTGVSGLWAMAGMPESGVLTSIDSGLEYQQVARQFFNQNGIPTTRCRLIAGRALDVLPRMAPLAYDLAIVDGDPLDAQAYLLQLERILRPGAIAIFPHALHHDHVSDPARREPAACAMRELGKTLRESESWMVNLLGVDDGLLVALKS